MKETRMQLFNQNSSEFDLDFSQKSTEFDLDFLSISSLCYADSSLIKPEKWRTFQQSLLLIVRNKSISPTIAKMEHFAIIVNSF